MSFGPRHPPLRHDGQWRVAAWIVEQLPAHRVYVEALGGTASVLLRKPRAWHEVYNDLDSEIVNLFKAMRDQGPALRRALKYTPFSREEFDLSIEPCDDRVEQARRTVVRSFMGSPSGVHAFRTVSAGRKPPPSHAWVSHVDTLALTIERLRGVAIEHRDAGQVMHYHDSADTLHYVDLGAQHASSIEPEPWLQALRHLKGAVVVHGTPASALERWCDGWQRVERVRPLPGGGKHVDALWMSPACTAGRPIAESSQEQSDAAL